MRDIDGTGEFVMEIGQKEHRDNLEGFLFGVGAEVGYGLPSGGKFALDIFRYDTSKSKQALCGLQNT